MCFTMAFRIGTMYKREKRIKTQYLCILCEIDILLTYKNTRVRVMWKIGHCEFKTIQVDRIYKL